jgi:pimeloyl-ACP methyl ester carboxylesterase
VTLTIASRDGSDIRAFDEGSGPVILVLHPGLDDGRGWGKVAKRLMSRFRVIRIHRRQYREDLKQGTRVSIAREVDDVLAVVEAVGEPMIVVGHSSGAVVALESIAAMPTAFVGAVIYEPPIVVDELLGGPNGAIHRRAREALQSGKPGKAMSIFLTDIAKLPPTVARMAGSFTTLVPRYRKLVPGQLDDSEAIDELGNRLNEYKTIKIPVVLVGGEKSPPHLARRFDALQRAIPHAERILMHKRGHDANLKAPGQLAEIITSLADRVLR